MQKFEGLISRNNSDIQSFTSLSKRNYDFDINDNKEKQEINPYIKKIETFLKGMKLEYIVDNKIKKNFSKIIFIEKPHIMFYMLDEEKIKQVQFYHKLIQNNQISDIFIKVENLKSKYKDNKLLIKNKLEEYENKIKQKMGKKIDKKNEEEITNSNFIFGTSELKKIKLMKTQLKKIENFLTNNSLIIPDFLPIDFFKKIFSFILLKKLYEKYIIDKNNFDINNFISAYELYNSLIIDNYFIDNNLIEQ